MVPARTAGKGRYSQAFLAAIDAGLAVRPEQRTQSIAQLREELGLEGLVAPSTVMTLAQPAMAPAPLLPTAVSLTRSVSTFTT